MNQDKRQIFTPSKIHNDKILDYYKDISCLIFGSACGILQLKAINGLIYFLLTSFMSSLLFHWAMITFRNNQYKYGLKDFYINPISEVYLGNIGKQIAIFTMMWCLLSALIS